MTSVAPSVLLVHITELLRLPLNTVVYPPLLTSLLSLSNHLDDNAAYSLIQHLHETGDLEPSCPDWERNFRLIINSYYFEPVAYFRTRELIACLLAQLYHEIADLDTLRSDIAELVMTVWEQTLVGESNQIIVEKAKEVFDVEIVLSATMDDTTVMPMAERVLALWVEVAYMSPPYYQDTVIASPSNPNYSPTQPLHTPLNRIRHGSLPTIPDSHPFPAPNRPVFNKAILAVQFLIGAFNKLALQAPQYFKVLLEDAAKRQSISAATMAIKLFREILQLVGVDKAYRRIQCPRARLIVIQWLLRLRADRDHRVYYLDGKIEEAHYLADLAHRTDVASRRTDEARRGAVEIVEKRRRRGVSVPSQLLDPTRRRRPVAPLASIEPEQIQVDVFLPEDLPRPIEMLWNYPDDFTISIEEDATRPSASMTTFETPEDGDKKSWLYLPVSLYVAALCDILERDTDWEIVSFILCHLPLQLANKHFFCGPSVKKFIRRLVMTICDAIRDPGLHNRFDNRLPTTLQHLDIQALLLHNLTVLISYHRMLGVHVEDGNRSRRSFKSLIVDVLVDMLGRGDVINKPCLEALSISVYELTDEMSYRTQDIVQLLSQIISNRNMAVHILELLILIGHASSLHSRSFRQEDYRKVFRVAMYHIAHQYRPDGVTLRTSDGRESYSFAQHVLNIAFSVIYSWFLAIRTSQRPKYLTFLTEELHACNKGKVPMEPTTVVCLDWLEHYAYASTDLKTSPSFLYHTIVAPHAGEYNVERSWYDQRAAEAKNVSSMKCWKVGNALITISILQQPPGWARLVLRKPSSYTEFVIHLENWPHVARRMRGDLERETSSLQQKPVGDETQGSLDIEEVCFFC